MTPSRRVRARRFPLQACGLSLQEARRAARLAERCSLAGLPRTQSLMLVSFTLSVTFTFMMYAGTGRSP
jgi:hypothetical protein